MSMLRVGLHGGFLFEEGRDSLARDAEQSCDGFDGESLGAQGEGFGGSELGAGGLKGGHVGRDEFDHPRGVFGFDKRDEVLAGLELPAKRAGASLQLAAAFGIVPGSSLDLGKSAEEPLDRGIVA